MTREEFNRKRNAGTLTVGDVLNNREFATPELWESLRLDAREAVRVAAETFDTMKAHARQAAEGFAEVDRITGELAADLWERIANEPVITDR